MAERTFQFCFAHMDEPAPRAVAARSDHVMVPDLTHASHTTRALADAWYISNALRMAGTAASEIVWSFTRAGNESSLLAVAPFVRSAQMQRMAIHMCAIVYRVQWKTHRGHRW